MSSPEVAGILEILKRIEAAQETQRRERREDNDQLWDAINVLRDESSDNHEEITAIKTGFGIAGKIWGGILLALGACVGALQYFRPHK